MRALIVDGGYEVLMHHISFELRGGNEGRINLCGHVHDEWVINNDWINVGIDVFGKPVSLTQIIAEKDERQKRLENKECLW